MYASVEVAQLSPNAKPLGTAIPALVMRIAVFMMLNQLKIAPAIRPDHVHRALGLGRTNQAPTGASEQATPATVGAPNQSPRVSKKET